MDFYTQNISSVLDIFDGRILFVAKFGTDHDLLFDCK